MTSEPWNESFEKVNLLSLVFQIPCEDRCLDPLAHLLRRPDKGFQTPPHCVFGGFWKTRVWGRVVCFVGGIPNFSTGFS